MLARSSTTIVESFRCPFGTVEAVNFPRWDGVKFRLLCGGCSVASSVCMWTRANALGLKVPESIVRLWLLFVRFLWRLILLWTFHIFLNVDRCGCSWSNVNIFYVARYVVSKNNMLMASSLIFNLPPSVAVFPFIQKFILFIQVLIIRRWLLRLIVEKRCEGLFSIRAVFAGLGETGPMLDTVPSWTVS